MSSDSSIRSTLSEVISSQKTLLLVGVFTLCWYYTSSQNAVATQQLVHYYNEHLNTNGGDGGDENIPMEGNELHMLHFAMMTSLTTMQLMVGLGIATLLSSKHLALGILSSTQEPTTTSTSNDGEKKVWSKVIGVLHYAGSLFTNLGFAYGSASIVQVIKLLEPIETLLLSYIVHQLLMEYKKVGKDSVGPNIGWIKVVSVVVIVTGTSLLLTSKGIKKNVNAHTVVFALCSGLALSCRNVAQKTSTRKETNVISTYTAGSSSSAGSDLREAAAKGLQNFIMITSHAIIPSLLILLFVEMRGVQGIEGSVVMWLLTSTGEYGVQGILFHGLYNIASISVLGLVSAPTHSILNVGKRILNVLVAAMFFSEPLGEKGSFGLSIAFIGGCIYSKANVLQKNMSWGGLSTLTSNTRKMALTCFAVLIPFVLINIIGLNLFLSYNEYVTPSFHENASYESTLVMEDIPPQLKIENRRKKKVVLLGPHERYNFGDLLFSFVLDKLLQVRAGYDPEFILKGGTVTRNMTSHGGYPDILSMKRIQELSRGDDIYGPYDIIYTGGEALGCNTKCAVGMLPTLELQQQARKERIYDCAYLVPKTHLLPTDIEGNPIPARNFAVVNSMGGFQNGFPACQAAANSADFAAYRDSDPLYPDSAIMTKELYHDVIAEMAKEVMKELFPDDPQMRGSQKKYIAVQHKNWQRRINSRDLADVLDDIARKTGAVIVFFAAGTAPHHDSFDFYKDISSYMAEPNIVYEMENVWKVVALISQAEAILETSLHVRIMSLIYFKPRITWCSRIKHRKFIDLWDASDSPKCIGVDKTWPVLSKYLGPNPEITQNMTMQVYEDMVKKYLAGFDTWSSMMVKSDS